MAESTVDVGVNLNNFASSLSLAMVPLCATAHFPQTKRLYVFRGLLHHSVVGSARRLQMAISADATPYRVEVLPEYLAFGLSNVSRLEFIPTIPTSPTPIYGVHYGI